MPDSSPERSPAPRWGFAAFGGSDRTEFYLRSVGRLTGPAAAAALAAGHALGTGRPGEAAPMVEILARGRGGGASHHMLSAAEFAAWLGRDGGSEAGARLAMLAACLSRPRARWAGFTLDRPLVMGILNVTPDSFSDGNDFLDGVRAVAHGRAMRQAGADIIDVGGESTRPGAAPVDPETEIARVVPVITALAAAGIAVSIDTRHAAVMTAAIEAGARIVNDVNALRAPGAIEAAGRSGIAVVLMHMRGEPGTMQQDPRYDVAPLDVLDFLEARLSACEAKGIRRADIAIDPGIGFGKNDAHNLAILSALGLYRTTGCAVLAGVSRKGFIGRIAHEPDPKQRLAGSLAAGLACVAGGADILRVHDVPETVQALRVAAALDATLGE